MGMTHIVVEGKVWWVRPRMRCRHKAHLGRASTLFECFAEVRLAVLCKFGGVCRFDGWVDSGRGGRCFGVGRHAGRWGVFRAWSQLRFGGVPRFLPVCVQREGRELASFFDVRLCCFGVGVVEERV